MNLAELLAAAPPDRLSEVLRLMAALSDQVLDAEIMSRPVPDDQVRALAGAARLLQDHGVEWPPLLSQVLHELALETADGRSDTEAVGTENEAKATRLNRFLGVFRKGRG